MYIVFLCVFAFWCIGLNAYEYTIVGNKLGDASAAGLAEIVGATSLRVLDIRGKNITNQKN